MSSIQKRNNGQWRARYRDHAGKEHAQHFARKIDAQHWLDQETTKLQVRSMGGPPGGAYDR